MLRGDANVVVVGERPTDEVLQLGFLGSTNHTLWALTGVSLSAVVLYGLIVHWDEASETIRRMAESRM